MKEGCGWQSAWHTLASAHNVASFPPGRRISVSAFFRMPVRISCGVLSQAEPERFREALKSLGRDSIRPDVRRHHGDRGCSVTTACARSGSGSARAGRRRSDCEPRLCVRRKDRARPQPCRVEMCVSRGRYLVCRWAITNAENCIKCSTRRSGGASNIVDIKR